MSTRFSNLEVLLVDVAFPLPIDPIPGIRLGLLTLFNDFFGTHTALTKDSYAAEGKGRCKPSFFILLRNVLGCIPNRAAAPYGP